MPRTDPLSRFSTLRTPQTQPIPGRSGMVKNDAGGYVFGKDLFRKVEDFVILGTAGGTYYVGQDELTTRNIDWLIEAIKADGTQVVKIIADVSTSKPPRAPKQRPAIFALALVFAFGDPDAVQAAKSVFNQVVRTTDHLSTFFGYAKEVRGKSSPMGTSLRTGRALRSALGSWYYAGDEERVAFKACKARQRKTPKGEKLDLRDILRISHPKADTTGRHVLLGWLAGKISDDEARGQLQAVDSFLAARAVTSEAEAIRVAVDRKVPWEFLPSEYNASVKVWEALLPHTGMTALLRNLARLTRLGVIKPFGKSNDLVVERLTNVSALRNARIHPMDVFLAMRVYNSGRSQPDPRRDPDYWTPVAEISDALEEAYELSFGYIEPTGRRRLIAVDSSGSMAGGWFANNITLGGSPIGSPYEVACVMALVSKRIEGKDAHVIDVDTRVHPSKITQKTNFREIARWHPSGGGTDMALPFNYALQNGLELDGFEIYSDMETWAGRYSHPQQALEAYRARFNPDARVVAVAMTSGGYSVADPESPGVLQVAGMDASLPKVIAEFMR